jgi:hypothetical protein
VEKIIILLLLFALPGIIRKLTGAGKAKPSRPPREPASRAPVDASAAEETPETAPEELPPWLRKLSDGLVEVQQRNLEKPEPAIIESMDVSPVEGTLHGTMVASEIELESDHRVMPAEHLPGLSQGYRTAPAEHLQHVTKDWRGVSDAGTTSVAKTHWRGKKCDRLPWKARPGKLGWRRAIVLAEILGPPRVNKPYRPVAEQDA